MNNITFEKVLDKVTWNILEKNPNLEDLCQEHGITILKLKYVGGFGYMSIEFMGFDIWCSENDEREWTPETDVVESMEDYIYRKIKEITKGGVINVKL